MNEPEPTLTWGDFTNRVPQLASFGAALLSNRPAYLATIRSPGMPRVHPVTPIITPQALFIFMEPTSPKRRDIEERGWFSLHNGVPDDEGTGGEFFITGRGVGVDDADLRALATEAASYDPADHHVLFELRLTEARCNGYGDVALPEPRRWLAGG
jgi:hypothetical protein